MNIKNMEDRVNEIEIDINLIKNSPQVIDKKQIKDGEVLTRYTAPKEISDKLKKLKSERIDLIDNITSTIYERIVSIDYHLQVASQYESGSIYGTMDVINLKEMEVRCSALKEERNELHLKHKEWQDRKEMRL